MNPLQRVDILIARYPELICEKNNIVSAYKILEQCYSNGGKLLVAGNGGSAADSEHIVGELMKGFEKKRELLDDYKKKLRNVDEELGTILGDNLQTGLPAISLTGHLALSTAYMNDCNPELIFAQQVNGFGNPKDVFLGISTSGNSHNILYAAIVAKAKGLKVIGLTGNANSKLSNMADVTIRSTNTRTYMIQEHHLPIYHCLCLMLEDRFFGERI